METVKENYDLKEVTWLKTIFRNDIHLIERNQTLLYHMVLRL